MGAQNFKEEDWGDGDTFCVSEIELKISKRESSKSKSYKSEFYKIYLLYEVKD